MLDPKFEVKVLAKTEKPQKLIYLAMHQDYSPKPVWDGRTRKAMNEKSYGKIIVEKLLKGGRGHWGVLEHPQITFNVCYFPHEVMVQARTHRVGTSFDVMSQRYCKQHILDVVNKKKDVEDVFYFRPLGSYVDRSGKNYQYTILERHEDILNTIEACKLYADRISKGYSEEHCRYLLPQNVRQHFVVSFNLRSCLHFLDLRSKKDAGIEIVNLALLLFEEIKVWTPEIADYYEKNRLSKARLAP
jgi:thymidylate synthase (FAD)